MYLTLLSREQKELFCDVAYIIVMADGVIRDEERDLLKSYGSELGSPVDLNNRNSNLEDILSHMIETSSEQEKKIIVFESIGLAVVDSDYSKEEQEIIKRMIERLGLPVDFEEKCKVVIEEYISFQKRVNEMILNS